MLKKIIDEDLRPYARLCRCNVYFRAQRLALNTSGLPSQTRAEAGHVPKRRCFERVGKPVRPRRAPFKMTATAGANVVEEREKKA